MAAVHGGPGTWLPGFHGSIHLALNSVLILECGRPCERLVGSGRFLVMSLGAVAANALAQLVTEGVNGSSLVIWAWGPPLFLAVHYARDRERSVAEVQAAARIRAVLTIMYVGVTLVMTVVPYMFGWRGNPGTAFLLGNRYHLVAAAVGVVGAMVLGSHIRRRVAIDSDGT